MQRVARAQRGGQRKQTESTSWQVHVKRKRPRVQGGGGWAASRRDRGEGAGGRASALFRGGSFPLRSFVFSFIFELAV